MARLVARSGRVGLRYRCHCSTPLFIDLPRARIHRTTSPEAGSPRIFSPGSSAETGSAPTNNSGRRARPQRAGDPDAVWLAAGEFVRIAVGAGGGQADHFEEFGYPRCAVTSR